MHPKLTTIIHTHNESKHIEACIDSACLVTESIIVVDMESTDDTVLRAQQKGVKIRSFPFTHYVEPAREFGISQAQTEWVFLLDADERMTPELAREIKTIISTTKNTSLDSNGQRPSSNDQSPMTHFKVPRKNMFGGKQWLKYGGWWPDLQLRLFKKKALITWPKQIHSTPQFRGTCSELNNSFEHHFHGNLEEMVHKTLVFEDIESDLLYDAKRPVNTLTFFRKFLGELNRRLILKRGFLDGTIGIIESFYQAYSKTITYLMLYEKYLHEQKNRSPL